MSLIARYLEQHGIATVVIGAAKDIVEHCGVPRFLFSDLPLGNAAGRPNDPQSQKLVIDLALDLLVDAPGPRCTLQTPLSWDADGRWKEDFSNAEKLPPEVRARRRAEFEADKRIARTRKEGDSIKES